MDTAIILASGAGTKIWPYGATMMKPVIPVANKPIIIWTLTSLGELGFERAFIVTTARGRAQISYTIAKYLPRGGKEEWPAVEFIIEDAPRGTAISLAKALEVVDCGEVLVIYGDVVTPRASLERLIDFHSGGDFVSCALVDPLMRATFAPERPQDWICARVSDGRIHEAVGHPRGGVTHRLCGVYTFREDACRYITSNPGYMLSVEVGMMPPAENELAQSIQMMAEDGRSVGAVDAEGFFVDVDKPWHILEANYALLEYMARTVTEDKVPASAEVSLQAEIRGKIVLGEGCRIGPGMVIEGNLWMGDGSIIDNGAIIGPKVSIGRGCEVSDYCRVGSHTSIGDRCVVGHAAEIDGILMENVYAVHYMEFSGIVGRSSDFGAATVCGTLRFDDWNTSHRIKGRYETPVHFANATYIGDFCRTGVNAILMPGVKVGPYSIIGPGVILKEDVPDRTYVSVEQQLIKKEWGPERYGW